ncbi:hypothetical protein [Streptomyces sp. NPDC090022]|uniref:hypothetical protein n=1 Tax=Streptomyces sp. NPDC090022 TaxID=3365920 RepID=UPI0037F52AF9
MTRRSPRPHSAPAPPSAPASGPASAPACGPASGPVVAECTAPLPAPELTEAECRRCGTLIAGLDGRYACGVCGWVNDHSEGHRRLPRADEDPDLPRRGRRLPKLPPGPPEETQPETGPETGPEPGRQTRQQPGQRPAPRPGTAS